MKKTITLMAVLISGIFSLVNAQSPYQLEVEQEVAGSDLYMRLYATRIGGADFAFGSCNFAVTIDTANLDLANAVKIGDGVWDNDTDAASYMDLFLGRGPNFINLSTRRNTSGSGSGSGQVLPMAKTLIGEVLIPIKNQCTTNTSTWVSQPAAQNKFPVTDIKPDAQFVNPDPNFPLCMAPAVPDLSYVGNDTVCEGTLIQLSTTATGTLQWYHDGVEITGETSQMLETTDAGTYTVEAINCICKTMSATSQTIVVNPLPELPVITQVGNSLQVNNTASQIFWYLNGQLIASNTTMITDITDGTYTVMFKNECGDKMSEPIAIVTDDVVANLNTSLEAFPNPFKSNTQLKLTLANSSQVEVSIYNVLGEVVEVLVSERLGSGEHLINFNTEDKRSSDGVYLAKVRIDSEDQIILKLVEQQ